MELLCSARTNLPVVPLRSMSAATHVVTNQPPPLADYNVFSQDRALVETVKRHGAGWEAAGLERFGAVIGSKRVIDLGHTANRFPPILKTHDRYGNRIDEVEFHPSYHELMSIGIGAGVASFAWNAIAAAPAGTKSVRGAHVARAAYLYLMSQAEYGVCCPMSMTYAGVPVIRKLPKLAELWEPLLLSREYDSRFQAAAIASASASAAAAGSSNQGKRGATIGMAMTEKQGGSDVRANTTIARPVNPSQTGPGSEYLLWGHKWFCSAPMSDGFLTLAYIPRETDPATATSAAASSAAGKSAAAGAMSCFFVPRFRPDGTKNNLTVMRLKDKLGNKANASSEIEYHNTWAVLVSEPGRGVPTIIEMVNHTRLDCSIGGAAIMRIGLAHALHHVTYRSAFGNRLLDQPLMKSVLADLAIEAEAATAMAFRIAESFDMGSGSKQESLFARIATPITKYWICKRTPNHVYEAMECHGGNGYTEDFVLARAYREAPLNAIWEGSGNVIALDVLRAMQTAPEAIQAFLQEIKTDTSGKNADLDQAVQDLEAQIANQQKLSRDGNAQQAMEANGRNLVDLMALTLQGSLLVRHAPQEVADVFCRNRLRHRYAGNYGAIDIRAAEAEAIIERHRPRVHLA
ncbi:acyl-CoA dehydrogenase [Capsaspora owczarzaki ATCC 30864]|uniref:Acyl-CoA dehydrogenase n=1 Tax=Capsaspora owczarzaki (strain ATCC 30864) TaxID=595528 RepID=A0A0D2X2M9_CAPO3|nr:acyl-CoA dehydrogenase [Capsaspora owczarzaki ATCC 30864]